MRRISFILAIYILAFDISFAQDISVEDSPACIVVDDTDGNVDIEQHIYYYSPNNELENYKNKIDELLLKEKLLTEKEKEQLDKEFELLLKKQQLDDQAQNFEDWLKFYENKLLLIKEKLAQLESKSPASYAIISDLITTYEGILQSSRCLYNDLDIETYEDNFGYKSLGFKKRDILELGYYFFIDEYSEGLARVKRLNKYGFIDINKEEVIPLKFDHAEPFSNGLALVQNDKYYYYIDKSGNYVKKKLFGATSFKNNRAIISYTQKKWNVVDSKFNVIKMKDISNSPPATTIETYQLAKAFPFDDKGMALVQDISGYWGYVNSEGQALVYGYGYISFFDENELAIAQTRRKFGNNTGAVNRKFEHVIDFDYQKIKKIGKELYAVKRKNLWGLVNSQGDPITKVEYGEFITEFKYDCHRYQKLNTGIDQP